jgi:hypothetical protein
VLLWTEYGLDIGFIDHLHRRLGTTINYSAIANLHTLQITIAHSKSSQSSVDVFWQRLPTAKILLHLCSRRYCPVNIPQPNSPCRSGVYCYERLPSDSPDIVYVFTSRYQVTYGASRNRCITTVLHTTRHWYLTLLQFLHWVTSCSAFDTQLICTVIGVTTVGNSTGHLIICWIRFPSFRGHALSQLVKALCCKLEGRGFDSRRGHWIFFFQFI